MLRFLMTQQFIGSFGISVSSLGRPRTVHVREIQEADVGSIAAVLVELEEHHPAHLGGRIVPRPGRDALSVRAAMARRVGSARLAHVSVGVNREPTATVSLARVRDFGTVVQVIQNPVAIEYSPW
jgi:hypothetical protein